MTRRGGRRRRYITPVRDAAVWVSSGRWGPRRARVESCAVVHRAEVIYDDLIRRGDGFGPGWTGSMTVTVGGRREWTIGFELIANAVWRRGRLFLQCPWCKRRATRIYHPTPDCAPRCRRCWGLSYASRSWSYKAGGVSAMLGSTASWTTVHRREERARESRARYERRRDETTAQKG